MKKRIECHVEGRVQMVMYRDFAMRKAKVLGLSGTAKNNQDGTVTVVAEGEEEQLGMYIEKLKRGSALSHVEHVEVAWSDAHGTMTDFSILYK